MLDIIPAARFLDRAERPNGRRAQWREAKQTGGLRVTPRVRSAHVTPKACFPHDAFEGP
jgi:hypothetical protein